MRISIGKVGRPHGIDGAFFVEQPSDDKRWWKTGAHFLAGGAPVEVVAHRTSSGRPVIRVAPEQPRGAALAVRRDRLPPPAEGEYYAVDLVGLEVADDAGTPLGRVRDVLPGVANDVLELDSGTLLPMVAECVREVDLVRGRIVIAPGFSNPQLP